MTSSIGSTSKKSKHEKINKLDVAEYIVSNNIKTELQVMNKAVERKTFGDRELAKFVLRMNSKTRKELIDDAWLMNCAPSKVKSKEISRIEKIKSFLDTTCECQGLWIDCAKDVLARNNIDFKEFTSVLRTLLEKRSREEQEFNFDRTS